MDEIIVKEVTERNVDDLCWVCISPDVADDPDWIRGLKDKQKWAQDMLARWDSFAKVAYHNGSPVGMIQYRPLPEERVVSIDCIFIPVQSCWGKGAASKLLRSLMEDVQKPMRWFRNRRPLALVTKTFPGQEPGQHTAREFFTRKGFRQVGKRPDHLYYPLKADFVYKPVIKKKLRYMPQDEDKGMVVIICGPSPCTCTYPDLKSMERHIREIYPEVPIRWLDSSEEPEEVKKRNVAVGHCIVNARLIRSFVLDKGNFQKEMKTALK